MLQDRINRLGSKATVGELLELKRRMAAQDFDHNKEEEEEGKEAEEEMEEEEGDDSDKDEDFVPQQKRKYKAKKFVSPCLVLQLKRMSWERIILASLLVQSHFPSWK